MKARANNGWRTYYTAGTTFECIASGETANIQPITREEMFLAKLGGTDVNTPTPITRKEQFLMKAVEAMSGGNTGGGDEFLSMLEGVL